MGLVEHRQELFENLVRLRRAGLAMPGNEDLSAVRLSLERELGETVSRRLAARALGVSHTALERWIKAGDLPVVYTRGGRLEVPVPALLDLRDAVDADRAQGDRRYALAPAMSRQREAARRLRADDLQPPRGDDGHARARARSLAYHRVVARQLRRPMVDEARHVLHRWRAQGRIDDHYAAQWEALLARPVDEIREAIAEESQSADDLRQNSPLAGLLSETERKQIIERVR
ncbi:hypothetical protein [Baekduia sp. Peel2402]|uniref:hypothetical protein n=1 Tax=Baekduia sp. Peel2402 TaxID=3458296 RepID=UPI00403EBD2C